MSAYKIIKIEKYALYRQTLYNMKQKKKYFYKKFY